MRYREIEQNDKVYVLYSGRLVVSKYTNDDLIIMYDIQTVSIIHWR